MFASICSGFLFSGLVVIGIKADVVDLGPQAKGDENQASELIVTYNLALSF